MTIFLVQMTGWLAGRSRRGVVAFVAALLIVAVTGTFAVGAVLRSGGKRADPALVRGVVDDNTTAFNLAEIPALQAAPLTGTGFRLVRVLHREAAYTRWSIRYRGDGLSLSGQLALPNHRTQVPLVVVAHGYADPGGYLRSGGWTRIEGPLARAGFAVLHPDYRNWGHSQHTSAVPAHPLGYPMDVLNAVAALKAWAGSRIDFSRTGLLGRSMGGGVAMDAIEARPSMFKAMLLYSPVSASAARDFKHFTRHDAALRARVEKAFGTLATNRPFWMRASAVQYFDRIRVPVLIVHGTKDDVCPYPWSVATAKAMKADGVNVTLTPYEGQGHEFGSLMPRFLKQMVAFYRARL